MIDLQIAPGLYLLHKQVSKTSTPIVTDIPSDHVVIIDCSGSMYHELPQIRQQLKNKLPMMMKEADTVTIIWFSGRNQFGVVVEGVPLRNAVDLNGVHRAIDNTLKPIGMTGFVEPLDEAAKVIGRLTKPGRAINLFFMSDGYDNQWTKDQILAAIDRLAPLVSSAAVVEYGWYCNRPLMVQMSERLGATEVLAESFSQYEPMFETAMTKRITGIKKIDVQITEALHGFAFAIQDGEILSFAANSRSVTVPEGLSEVYWFAEMAPTANFYTMGEVGLPKFRTEDKSAVLRSLYAGLVPLTQRMLSTDIFRVLKVLGDVRLIRQFTNCFGKQAYVEFQSTVAECAFDENHRLVEGYNPDEVPAEDAFTVIDLLYTLAGDDGNLFYPNHESFHYERIGRKALATDRILTEAETAKVGQIAAALTTTRDPAEIKRLQQELSELAEDRTAIKFVANDPDAGYPVGSLVFNEDRPNISAQVRIPGTVDLGGVVVDPNTFANLWNLPSEFPTHIYRNYTIVRDGIRNVKVLPVSLTDESHRILVFRGVLENAPWMPDHIYEIDLLKLPLINRKMVKSVSAKDLFAKQFDLLTAKAAQKVFNHYSDEYFPPETTRGIADRYGSEAAVWLAEHGLKDYGFNPKVTLAEATESYYGKELSVSIAGMSSLPTVKSVLEKLGSKKLTARESLLGPAVTEVKGFLVSDAYTGIGQTAREAMLKIWLTNRKRDTINTCRQLMREIAQIKFSVIVGQVWFTEFGSLDENSLTMQFDGSDVVCTANLKEIEIKI